MLFDSHCHLDPAYLPDGSDPVLARAEAASVVGFVCIGVGRDLAAARGAIALAERRANVFAAVGIHPHDAEVLDDEMMVELAAMARHPRVVAVGETGLDYHYDHSPREVQRRVFRQMIALAREVKKPVVVHTRSAAADTLAVLREEQARDVGGIIHCFSEDRSFAERALDLDFDLSFSGILTFKNAAPIREAAKFAPADRIMLETDSPFLAPVPVRGRPCEPAYIVHTARCLADIRGIGEGDIGALTTANAVRRLSLAFVKPPAHDETKVSFLS